MARGRARYQRGRVVATEGGGSEIHYNVYLTDPTTDKPKRHHCSRIVGYKPKMHRADAEKILGVSTAVPSPERRTGPSHLAIGCGISTFQCATPTGGTRRVAPTSTPQQPRLSDPRTGRAQDVTKFQVQMLLNRLAAEEYSYTVVYRFEPTTCLIK
jgi:hypothetical protein